MDSNVLTTSPAIAAKCVPTGILFRFKYYPKDKIFLMNQHLTPGTYCLPRGIGNCNQKTSYHVFSLTWWKCIPRQQTLYQEQTLRSLDIFGHWNAKRSSVPYLKYWALDVGLA
ncbi:uncharacterized protein TNCV_5034931 [Trichonephila clavipes]|nr:uncharacterized protein TNCV_5034931 [Trichonephila clavipes]